MNFVFEEELENKVCNFSLYHSILWARRRFDIQKDSLILSSRSAFPVFSSAGQQVGRFDNQFKVMCLGSHPSIPETFLCGGYSSVVKAWDSRCSKVKLIKLLGDGLLGFIDMASPNLAFPKSKAAKLWAHAFHPQTRCRPPPCCQIFRKENCR